MITVAAAVVATKQSELLPQAALSQKRNSTILRGLSLPGNRFAKIANSSKYQNICLLVVILNAIWIGVDTDWNRSEQPGLIFVVMNNLFCAWFSSEVIIRILAYDEKVMFFTEKVYRFQNIFDTVLMLLMVNEVWILPVFGVSANLKSLSSLRLLRLLRISRIFHLIPELATMVKSMAAAARSVTSTLVLELACMYVFSIIVAQWAKGRISSGTTEDDFLTEYFGNIIKSMMTLLQLSVYDAAFRVIRAVQDRSVIMAAVLILFILVGAFLILNILIGVIAEIVDATKRKEEEKQLLESIGKVFDLIDEDGSGSISKEEYNDGAKPLLSKLGIDPMILENAFAIIDTDGSGTLERQEFMTMLGKMLKPPIVEDIHITLTKLDTTLDEWNKDLTAVQARIESTIQQTVEDVVLGESRVSNLLKN